jgi:hypothetical protein
MNVHTKQQSKSNGLADEISLSLDRELKHLKTTVVSLSKSTIHTCTLLALDLEWISLNIDNFGTSALTVPPAALLEQPEKELLIQKWKDNCPKELEEYISARLTQLGNHCGMLLNILKSLHYKEETENLSEFSEGLN